MQGHPLLGTLLNSLLNTTRCSKIIKTQQERTIGTSRVEPIKMRWPSQPKRKQVVSTSKIRRLMTCSGSLRHNKTQLRISNNNSSQIPLPLGCNSLIAINLVRFQHSQSLSPDSSLSISSETLEMVQIRKPTNLSLSKQIQASEEKSRRLTMILTQMTVNSEVTLMEMKMETWEERYQAWANRRSSKRIEHL